MALRDALTLHGRKINKHPQVLSPSVNVMSLQCHNTTCASHIVDITCALQCIFAAGVYYLQNQSVGAAGVNHLHNNLNISVWNTAGMSRLLD